MIVEITTSESPVTVAVTTLAAPVTVSVALVDAPVTVAVSMPAAPAIILNLTLNQTQVIVDVAAAPTLQAYTFEGLTGKPTTLSGYGITDAATTAALEAEIAARIAGDEGGLQWVQLTSAEYDAIASPDPDTIYDITGLVGPDGEIFEGTLPWSHMVLESSTNGVDVPISGGSYLVYSYQGTTVYRFISTASDTNGYPTEDAFYTTLSGGALSGKICQRNL